MNKVKREVIKESQKETLEYRVHYEDYAGEDFGFVLSRYVEDDYDDDEVGMWWIRINNNPWEDNELTEIMIEDIQKTIKRLNKRGWK